MTINTDRSTNIPPQVGNGPPAGNPVSTWSMCAGILGLAGGVFFGVLSLVPPLRYLIVESVGVRAVFAGCEILLWVLMLLAIVLGHVGQRRVSRSGDSGRVRVAIGLVTGYLGLVLTVLMIVFVALANLMFALG